MLTPEGTPSPGEGSTSGTPAPSPDPKPTSGASGDPSLEEQNKELRKKITEQAELLKTESLQRQELELRLATLEGSRNTPQNVPENDTGKELETMVSDFFSAEEKQTPDNFLKIIQAASESAYKRAVQDIGKVVEPALDQSARNTVDFKANAFFTKVGKPELASRDSNFFKFAKLLLQQPGNDWLRGMWNSNIDDALGFTYNKYVEKFGDPEDDELKQKMIDAKKKASISEPTPTSGLTPELTKFFGKLDPNESLESWYKKAEKAGVFDSLPTE